MIAIKTAMMIIAKTTVYLAYSTIQI